MELNITEMVITTMVIGPMMKKMVKGLFITQIVKKHYDGEWSNGKRHGNGIEYKNAKKHYEGELSDNKANGKGIQYDPNGKACYDGQWLNGKRHGQGTLYHDNKKFYHGHFRNNKKHGHGALYDKNGKKIIYEGSFENDEKVVIPPPPPQPPQIQFTEIKSRKTPLSNLGCKSAKCKSKLCDGTWDGV